MTKEQLRAHADTYLSVAKEHRLQDIHEAYGRPSSDKVHIFNRIVKTVNMLSRHTPVGVMTHNCQLFTVGYCYIESVNGVDTAFFVYKTIKNSYTLCLEDDEIETIHGLCV